MRSNLVAFASFAFLITGGCTGAYGSLGMAEDGSESGEADPDTSGGEGSGESGNSPTDVGDGGGVPDGCLPAGGGSGIGGPGYGRPVASAFSPVPEKAYILTEDEGFAQVIHIDFDPSAKLAVLDGWDLFPAGIEVGPDGSVYVGATLQRDSQGVFESRQWATRMTADLHPIWRKQIHPYSPDQDAWADRVIFVDDQLWIFGSVSDLENEGVRGTVTVADTEGEVVDTVEIEFPEPLQTDAIVAHAVWTDGTEVIVGGDMLVSVDGEGWEDGWIASLSAGPTVDWVASPAPILTDLTATADRLWVVEGETLHEWDREANPIAQHPLSGPAVGIEALDDHLVVGISSGTESTADCLDLEGQLISSEQAYPPDLTTLRARPHEVLLAGKSTEGEFGALITYD